MHVIIVILYPALRSYSTQLRFDFMPLELLAETKSRKCCILEIVYLCEREARRSETFLSSLDLEKMMLGL